MAKAGYHHGDLRNALIAAAEDELRQKGVEGFTLRGCARRAGVSHAAPAHHFHDANRLLTALAAVGYERLAATQTARRRAAPPDPRSQLVASGLGYIDFAMGNPELFRLIFTSRRIDFEDPALRAAGSASFDDLVEAVQAVRGGDPRPEQGGAEDAHTAWAVVHGLAELLLAGRMASLLALPPEAREQALHAIIARSLPAEPRNGGSRD